MKHHLELTCKKSAAEVFDTCKQILLPQNYRITDKTENEFIFEGGGLLSTRQNPLLGATKIAISISNETLELNSDLGGVVRANLFFLTFPPALLMFLGITFYFQGMGTQVFKQAPFMILPWLIISPVVYIVLKKRTKKTLDALAHNIVNA